MKDAATRPLDTAVLFLIFNRPDTTSRVFEAIRRARPARLYVAADGPRPDHGEDSQRCQSAREVATGVDWPCEVKTLFRDDNLGCGAAVCSAIDWFFEQESEGIILEDDCLPDDTFFPFCEELVERYRDVPEVMEISGEYYHGPHDLPPASYFFSRYIGIWGWATWRRAWASNDRAVRRWPELRPTGWLSRIGGGHEDFVDYWTHIFDDAHAGRIDGWGYQWGFSFWARDGLCVQPTRNLVVNIGFGSDATHTLSARGVTNSVPLESIRLPLRHPSGIRRDEAADRWMDLNVYCIKFEKYRRILRQVPGLRWAVRRLRAWISR